jgi:hypothetical protein
MFRAYYSWIKIYASQFCCVESSLVRDKLASVDARVYAIVNCIDCDIIDELSRLVRNNVDVRLVINRSCNCVRGGVGWRSVIYVLVPVLIIALVLAFYSPYVGVLTGLLGVLVMFSVIGRRTIRSISGWVRIVPEDSGFLKDELLIVDDEAFVVSSTGSVTQVPVDDAVRYFDDIWRVL